MKIEMTQDCPDNSALEALMMKACAEPAWRPAFYRQLLESRVLVLVPDKPIVPNAQGNDVIRFVQWRRVDGQSAIPFFTSAKTLFDAIPQGAKCLVLEVPTFLALTRGALLHLNPHSEFNLELTPDDVGGLLTTGTIGKTEAFRLETKREVVVSAVTETPTAMLEALGKLFSQFPTVEKAYLTQLKGLYEGGEPSLLLGIEMAGDAEPVAQATGMVVRDTYCGSLKIDVTVIREDPTAMPASTFNGIAPFYDCCTAPLWVVSPPTRTPQ
ncbi:enhanced serine sensitivity protein SseB C-terminal domain-containing protein [Tahibacter amnicola]|uniref:Enhanced serine sensitivity protein SseB C-terminal domain-containing protein n=1 Tax=Tahibacter amnicola TaxID=2976241 RepID=A0ABY6B7Q2_9GAMM|nr:enhanced serine sensitivity protein SseB C-terminal domain-containing protein [Tahibacter amnicola]UXI66123.1 enhanced serine sensitivity protein SseB C-terminal domain-containing protein [Tahibacter amnicola]